jgi:hypothetical protein
MHLALLVGTDFFTAEVLTLRGLITYYVLFFIHLESRRVDIAGVTVHPDEQWMRQHYPEEAPVHRVKVDGFWMDRTPVTNREFRKFVEATGYVTFAEIAPDPKDYPGALPHMLKPGSLVYSTQSCHRSSQFRELVEFQVRCQLASPLW